MDARGLANAAWAFTAVALFGRPLVSLTSARVPCGEPSPQGLSTRAVNACLAGFSGQAAARGYLCRGPAESQSVQAAGNYNHGLGDGYSGISV